MDWKVVLITVLYFILLEQQFTIRNKWDLIISVSRCLFEYLHKILKRYYYNKVNFLEIIQYARVTGLVKKIKHVYCIECSNIEVCTISLIVY